MNNIIVKRIEKSMIDECVDMYINTFSKEPWYDTYDSREQGKGIGSEFLKEIGGLVVLGR